jgi:hypothetical protein
MKKVLYSCMFGANWLVNQQVVKNGVYRVPSSAPHDLNQWLTARLTPLGTVLILGLSKMSVLALRRRQANADGFALHEDLTINGRRKYVPADPKLKNNHGYWAI